MTIYMDAYQHCLDYGIAIMDHEQYLVVEHKNIHTGETKYTFHSPKEGCGGNMDNSIKRYHGWRGTTNDTERYAIGVREVIKQKAFQNGRSRITLSDDLHPEWE